MNQWRGITLGRFSRMPIRPVAMFCLAAGMASMSMVLGRQEAPADGESKESGLFIGVPTAQFHSATFFAKMSHDEPHRLHRSGWLRAAVLGANDGVVSTASLIVGVAAAGSSSGAIVLAGTAGLVAGALSMAAGEYVSVKSQQDLEMADLKMESDALEQNHQAELQELAGIYRERGLDPALADEVARQLMEHDPLGAHARDDIGIIQELIARPYQAAIASGGMFATGAAIPLLLATICPVRVIPWVIPACSVFTLAVLGALAARIGGASAVKGAFRVSVCGSAAMAVTALVGKLFGVSV